MVNQISQHPVAQSSWHKELTITLLLGVSIGSKKSLMKLKKEKLKKEHLIAVRRYENTSYWCSSAWYQVVGMDYSGSEDATEKNVHF